MRGSGHFWTKLWRGGGHLGRVVCATHTLKIGGVLYLAAPPPQ